MKATTTAAILLTLFFATVIGFMLHVKPTTALPDVIQVPNNSSIQEAINNANDGDTILVAAGIYNETVVIDKSITLIGAGSNNTFIVAKRIEPVISVKASNVKISGFTIKNGTEGVFLQGSNMSTISNNTITSNNAQGVHFYSSYGNMLSNNTISLNGFEGIFVYNSNDNLISGNVITNNKYVGIDLLDSNTNRISNNTITFHQNVSLHAQGIWSEYSNNTLIEGNIILNNAWGIDAYLCDNNTVYGNIISNNYYGIALYNCNNNSFYYTNFVNNTHQVDSYLSINNWDNGTQGNYWSDYNGTDNNSDGIGDTPYIIDENNQDRYPLMSRCNPSPTDVIAPITTHDYDGLWKNQDFRITLTAEDFSGIKAIHYRINNTQTISNVSANGQPFITSESANNTLEYWSVDNADNEEKPHKILTGIKLDKTVPYGSVVINNNDDNATSPSVTLNLFGNDTLSGMFQMRFSNDGLTWNSWEKYSTTKTWELAGDDGLKTVYVQYVDNAALVSHPYSDTIILDTTAPTVLMLSPTNGSVIRSSEVTIQWTGTDAGVGIDHYEIRLDNDASLNTETNHTYTFKGLSDGSHTVLVKAFDKLGRSSETILSFIVNTSPIGGPGYIEEAALAVIVAVSLGVVALYIFKIRRRIKK